MTVFSPSKLVLKRLWEGGSKALFSPDCVIENAFPPDKLT